MIIFLSHVLKFILLGVGDSGRELKMYTFEEAGVRF